MIACYRVWLLAMLRTICILSQIEESCWIKVCKSQARVNQGSTNWLQTFVRCFMSFLSSSCVRLEAALGFWSLLHCLDGYRTRTASVTPPVLIVATPRLRAAAVFIFHNPVLHRRIKLEVELLETCELDEKWNGTAQIGELYRTEIIAHCYTVFSKQTIYSTSWLLHPCMLYSRREA